MTNIVETIRTVNFVCHYAYSDHSHKRKKKIITTFSPIANTFTRILFNSQANQDFYTKLSIANEL